MRHSTHTGGAPNPAKSGPSPPSEPSRSLNGRDRRAGRWRSAIFRPGGMLGSLRKTAVMVTMGLAIAPAPAPAFYVSKVEVIAPPEPRLTLTVLNRDERLTLQNRTGKTVVVRGYDGEPYLRFLPDGTVERNARSSATYLNEDRLGAQPVPAEARPDAKPRWVAIASGGAYAWFDHRIHLTDKREPRELRGKTDVTRVLRWRVPLTVDARPVAARGSLYWDPSKPERVDSSNGFPVAAAIGIGAAALALGAVGLALFRRRRRPPRGPRQSEPAGEAW
jgi:hypothetical protein